jgi:hypothetical protein
MKISSHEGHWIVGRTLGAALIVSLSSLALSAHATTYYADNAYGDIGFDGSTNIVISFTNHGPKRHVTDAISVASNADQVVVAAGFYQETLWDPGAKSLTLLPPGQVTIVRYRPRPNTDLQRRHPRLVAHQVLRRRRHDNQHKHLCLL